MNALRLFVLTAIAAAVSAPVAAAPADGASTTADCSAAPRSLVQRRIHEEAARGMPALIGFVNRTKPFYQLTVVDAVAAIDGERERRTACMRASLGDLSD
jgi:hypothetical protein